MDRPVPVDEEYFFDGRPLVSETDINGIMTFANRRFCEISGYSVDEIVGQSHNTMRHPDMPKATFAQLWKTILSGTIWHGLIKNLRKDGKYYWVDSEISPMYNNDGTVKGYMSAHKPASRRNIEETATLYEQMITKES